MIGYLRGYVIERRILGDTAVEIVLDVAGVGYRVLVTPRVAASIAAPMTPAGTTAPEVALFVHTHVREGSITLYGFGETDERRAFEILLGAHGVGPALGLAIVAVHSPDRLVEIVAGDDVDSLTEVPGVGRKTAMRLLLDLKARFGDLDGAVPTMLGAMSAARSAKGDVVEALNQLGYGPEEVRVATRNLPAEGSAEELLRFALRELAPRR